MTKTDNDAQNIGRKFYCSRNEKVVVWISTQIVCVQTETIVNECSDEPSEVDTKSSWS